MAKRFQILLLILCLGIFIIPKQNFSAQSPDTSCCTKKISAKDCCKTKKNSKKPCHKSEKSSCEGNCPKCHMCSVSFVFFGINPSDKKADEIKLISSTKEKFTYLTPEFSSANPKIWQPPKIG